MNDTDMDCSLGDVLNDNTCKHNWESDGERVRCVKPRGHFGLCEDADGRQAPIVSYPPRPAQLKIDTTAHPVGLVIATDPDLDCGPTQTEKCQ